MWIPRDIEPRLQRSARTRPVLVLTGARQTGKTSTFRRLFPEHEFVSLDLPTEAEQAEKEPESFLRQHPAPVIIDEVRYAPGLFRYLKIAVDADRSSHGRFLLTGPRLNRKWVDGVETGLGRNLTVRMRGGKCVELSGGSRSDSAKHSACKKSAIRKSSEPLVTLILSLSTVLPKNGDTLACRKLTFGCAHSAHL